MHQLSVFIIAPPSRLISSSTLKGGEGWRGNDQWMYHLVAVGVHHRAAIPVYQILDVGIDSIDHLLHGITNVCIRLIHRMGSDGEVLRVDHDRWAPVVLLFDSDRIIILAFYASGTHRPSFEVDLTTARLQTWKAHSALRWLRGRLEAISPAHCLCW